jgi:hypothetical protein
MPFVQISPLIWTHYLTLLNAFGILNLNSHRNYYVLKYIFEWLFRGGMNIEGNRHSRSAGTEQKAEGRTAVETDGIAFERSGCNSAQIALRSSSCLESML